MSEASMLGNLFGKIPQEVQAARGDYQDITSRTVDGKTLGSGLWTGWAQCGLCEQWFELCLCTHCESQTHIQCGACSSPEGYGTSPRDRGDDSAKAWPLKIPVEYMQCSLTGIPRDSLNIIRAWPKQAPCVAIVGKPDAGKTWASYARAKELARSGCGVLFMNELEARSEWSSQLNENRKRLLDRWKRAPHLILDDLGRADNTPGWQGAIDEVISHRIAYQMPTLVNTKYPGSKLKRYGDSFADRLSHQFVWAPLPQQSRRRPVVHGVSKEKVKQNLF